MSAPPPPGYSGTYYQRPIEGYLTPRNVFALNALGLVAIWIAILVRIAAGDPNTRNFAFFLVITGGIFAAFGSVMGALGSKRTTDMQNLGLLVWAGLVLVFTMLAFQWIE
jgi:hypothetical protein